MKKEDQALFKSQYFKNLIQEMASEIQHKIQNRVAQEIELGRMNDAQAYAFDLSLMSYLHATSLKIHEMMHGLSAQEMITIGACGLADAYHQIKVNSDSHVH